MSEKPKYWEELGTRVYGRMGDPHGAYWISPRWGESMEGTAEEKAAAREAEAVKRIREFKAWARPYLHECPCCGERTIIHPGNLEQCDVCGWYDDDAQSEDPDFMWGAVWGDDEADNNPMPLREARKRWEETHEPIQPITEIPRGELR